MNERIREIAKEAKVHMVAEHRLEDFAHKIVIDCARTAGLMEHEGRKGIGAQILDNFGVKDD